KIVATTLTVKTIVNGGAAITLANAANDVTTLDLESRNAADTADAAGTISYRDATGFAVQAVHTTANATLQSGAAVTETGTVLAAGLELLGSGPYTLDNAANAVATLAGSTAAVTLANSAALGIGTVNTAGLTSTGAVSLTVAGAVTQSQKIVATTLTVKTIV